jgi:ribosomal subunit interface protein
MSTPLKKWALLTRQNPFPKWGIKPCFILGIWYNNYKEGANIIGIYCIVPKLPKIRRRKPQKERGRMKFTFMEKKLQVPGDVKAYAERKIGKLDRFFKNESEAYITFGTERSRFKAEVTISNNGMFYRVSELTGDMYASIDSAVASIERQIRKNKTRLGKRLRDGAFEREVKPEITVAGDEGEETDFSIVRTKRFSLKPMTPEEAILQMNLLEHEFFVFINQNDDAFSVVYRRKQGGYGLISAEDVH